MQPTAASSEPDSNLAPGLARIARLLQQNDPKAVTEARRLVAAAPGNAAALRLLGRALRSTGANEEAAQAELDAISASAWDPLLLSAAEALLANDLPVAERLLRQRLIDDPFDVAAIRMMGELAGRLGRNADAEKLLRRALDLAPAFGPARSNLAMAVYRQNRPAEAVEILDELLARDPENASGRNLKAAALGRLGSYEEAIDIYEKVLEQFPSQAKIWMSYGHALKTVGRLEDGIAAYRRALDLNQAFGEAWWSLANLKTVPFSDDDLSRMEDVAEDPALNTTDRLHVHFALGKALEQRDAYEASFGHYAEGNRLRRAQLSYDADDISQLVQRSKSLFTRSFFESRAEFGDERRDPIFILGMPRAGSTLIEQILASHPQIEGTMELPDIPALAKKLGAGDTRSAANRYPLSLAELSADRSRELGSEYLQRTRVQRKTERPYFIDKLPNNWINIGFIRMILPNGKIIDARRHPLDCCFSNFKQHYARGQAFSYSLGELARYYGDYVDYLDHIDAVLPRYVHRVYHEALIEDPESEVRRLLDYLGLPFEGACLRFHETRRAVRTPSSEQVRRPINRDAIGQWRHYEPWLEPLKSRLAGILESYPYPA